MSSLHTGFLDVVVIFYVVYKQCLWISKILISLTDKSNDIMPYLRIKFLVHYKIVKSRNIFANPSSVLTVLKYITIKYNIFIG